MITNVHKEKSGQKINLRISTELRDLIDFAAKASGKDRTSFMLEAAKEKATNALLDRRTFEMSDEGADQVMNVFSKRLTDIPEINELMAKKPEWK